MSSSSVVVAPGYGPLMPTNFSQILTNDEINQLIAFLMTKQ